ncbi:hypothetical protein V5G24_23215 [Xanthobacter sp. VTT E-85241]|uniref:hypothetical protein n=1 Tax=Roseixanthobacter finlandensis TaxID=3119922 RepID=UPI00372C72F0
MTNDQSQPARTWWPEFLVDESMPAGKAHPTEWIAGALVDGDGVWGFMVGGAVSKVTSPDDDDPADVYAVPVLLDERVDFTWSEPRGRREVTIYPDGTYRVEGVPPADFTNCWELGEPESCADTLEAFVREFASPWGGLDKPEVITVHFIKWGGDEPFRLQLVDGAPAFVPVKTGDSA